MVNWPTAIVVGIAIIAATSILKTWILRKNTTVSVNRETKWKDK